MTIKIWIKALVVISYLFFHNDAKGQDYIQVNGNKIHFEKKGAGSPCIIFVSGYGDPLNSFDSVFDKVSKLTTAIRYSRSGIGKSGYSKKAKDFDQIVDELEAFINVLFIQEPIILIGHSYGGLIIRAYAKRHPKKVCGLLFDDSTFEDYFVRLSPYEKNAEMIERKEHEEWLKTDSSKATNDEFNSLWKVWHSPDNWIKWFEPMPNIPIFILTSMKITGESLRNSETVMNERYSAHSRWTKGSSISLHLGITTAGHFIHKDEPEIFVNTIDMLIDKTRKTKE